MTTKNVLLSTAAVVLLGVAGVMIVRHFAESVQSAPEEASARSAAGLKAKIAAIKNAEKEPRHGQLDTVEVSEVELKSAVLFLLRDKIPAKIDSFDVQLTPGAIAANTQLTFPPEGTGNALVDAIVGGTHNLYLKGKMSGAGGEGMFELEEIRVDGIPVPKSLVEALFNKYVKPRYPDADIKKPFELPWGIDSLTIETGTARITY